MRSRKIFGYLGAIIFGVVGAVWTQYKDERDFQDRFDEAYEKKKAQEEKEKAD